MAHLAGNCKLKASKVFKTARGKRKKTKERESERKRARQKHADAHQLTHDFVGLQNSSLTVGKWSIF
jgi:hypothetical protein